MLKVWACFASKSCAFSVLGTHPSYVRINFPPTVGLVYGDSAIFGGCGSGAPWGEAEGW